MNKRQATIDRLELGCGNRPTNGYLHQDIMQFVDLDFTCNPWEIALPENSLSEVIAIGVMEHLSFKDFESTVKHVHYLLKPSGIFLFDVPDLSVWAKYLIDVIEGRKTPYPKEHIYNTIWGWQRWKGDEHKSGWTNLDVYNVLTPVFNNFETGQHNLKEFTDRNIVRNRFSRPDDAHIYVKAVK